MTKAALVGAGAGLCVLLTCAPPASPQSAAFSGRYRLTLRFGASCQASVPSVSLAVELSASQVSQGTEIDGRPVAADDANLGRLMLLAQQAHVHGPCATIAGGADRAPITTLEGLLVVPWLMLDGTLDSGSGPGRAQGTAFGTLEVGRPGDDVPNTLGSCRAADHTWSLEPL